MAMLPVIVTVGVLPVSVTVIVGMPIVVTAIPMTVVSSLTVPVAVSVLRFAAGMLMASLLVTRLLSLRCVLAMSPVEPLLIAIALVGSLSRIASIGRSTTGGMLAMISRSASVPTMVHAAAVVVRSTAIHVSASMVATTSH